MRSTPVFVAVAAGFAVGGRADIVLTPPPDGQHLPRHVCVFCDPPGAGYTSLLNLDLDQASDMPSGFGDLIVGRINSQFGRNRWRAELNQSLSGNLVVTKYVAQAMPAWHGAQFAAELQDVSGLADGQQFTWLQFFSWSGDTSETWIADPRDYETLQDGTVSDGHPFYWNFEDVHPGTSQPIPMEPGLTSDGMPYFDDEPRITGLIDPSVHAGRFSANLFLVSWDGTYDPGLLGTEPIQVYAQLSWGFEYSCVPTPGAWAIGCIGFVMVRRRRR